MNFLVESDGTDNLYSLLKALPNIQVTGFYTNEAVPPSANYAGISVMSIYEATKLYRDNDEVNFIVHDTHRVEFLTKKLNKLSDLGVNTDDVLIASKEFFLTGEVNKLYKFEKYNRLPYLEYRGLPSFIPKELKRRAKNSFPTSPSEEISLDFNFSRTSCRFNS